MLMLSPRWASVRMSAQLLMVREVPPPPEEVSSWDSRAVTAGWVRDFSWDRDGGAVVVGWGRTAYCFDYAGEHIEWGVM